MVFRLHKGKCKYCGKEKEYKYKSWIKTYCSKECSLKDRPPAKMATVTCQYCKKDFELRESQKNSREKRGDIVKYCSQKCSGLAYRKHPKIAKKCKTCGKETYKKTFCSRECTRVPKQTKPPRKRNGYWMENGYKVLYVEHDKSIKEHIKVMEDHIGRKLTKDEVVHHINEDRLDNRIENLQLMTRGEHSSYHRKKEIAEGKELFGGRQGRRKLKRNG